MLKKLAGRLTYANVVATLALFFAISGGAWRALSQNECWDAADQARRSAQLRREGRGLEEHRRRSEHFDRSGHQRAHAWGGHGRHKDLLRC